MRFLLALLIGYCSQAMYGAAQPSTPLQIAAEETIIVAAPNLIKNLEAVYRHANIPFSIHIVPTARAVSGISNNTFDAISLRTPLAAKFIPKLRPVPVELGVVKIYKWTLKNPTNNSFSIEIASVRGYLYNKTVESILNTELYKVTDAEMALNMLLRQRVGSIVLGEREFNKAAKGLQIIASSVVKEKDPILSLPLYHMVHEKNAYLIPRLQKSIEQLINSGVIKVSH